VKESRLVVSLEGEAARGVVVLESGYFPGTGGAEAGGSTYFPGIGGGRGFSNGIMGISGLGGLGGRAGGKAGR